jgi:hypothetical protein
MKKDQKIHESTREIAEMMYPTDKELIERERKSNHFKS